MTEEQKILDYFQNIGKEIQLSKLQSFAKDWAKSNKFIYDTDNFGNFIILNTENYEKNLVILQHHTDTINTSGLLFLCASMVLMEKTDKQHPLFLLITTDQEQVMNSWDFPEDATLINFGSETFDNVYVEGLGALKCFITKECDKYNIDNDKYNKDSEDDEDYENSGEDIEDCYKIKISGFSVKELGGLLDELDQNLLLEIVELKSNNLEHECVFSLQRIEYYDILDMMNNTIKKYIENIFPNSNIVFTLTKDENIYKKYYSNVIDLLMALPENNVINVTTEKSTLLFECSIHFNLDSQINKIYRTLFCISRAFDCDISQPITYKKWKSNINNEPNNVLERLQESYKKIFDNECNICNTYNKLDLSILLQQYNKWRTISIGTLCENVKGQDIYDLLLVLSVGAHI